MPRIAPLAPVLTLLALAAVLLSGCTDKAQPDYARCVQAESAGDLEGAWHACGSAVQADPQSASGKAAQLKMNELRPRLEKLSAEQVAKAEAARAEQPHAAPTPQVASSATTAIDQRTRIKHGGITTSAGVMLFKEADGPKQAAQCMKKYQVGNPEAEEEARAFASPKVETISQLRALCLIATSEVVVAEGTPVLVVGRSGAVVHVRVLEGDAKGSVLYAMTDSVTN